MRAAFVCSLIVITWSGIAFAQEPAAQKPFEPVSGQDGKDVVWIPSPPDMVEKMMEMAQEAGVADSARFVEADMYTYDITGANVLALFLLPVNMNRLAPKFLNLAPGSRVVSNTFGIDGWEADQRATLPRTSGCESWCDVLLWIVPAKVAGAWRLDNGRLALVQDHQRLQGTLSVGGKSQPITGSLRGNEITLTAGRVTYTGIVDGTTITGTVTSPTGEAPWRARR